MSDGCNDKRFEQMLHAYELGMLTEEERQHLECHLMDCPHCWEQVLRMEPAATLMKRDSDVHEVIRRVVDAHAQTDTAPRRKLRRAFVPSIIVAAAVLAALLFKPWHIEILPDQEAVAVENRLAVMYFDNIVDPGDSLNLGEIITNLLITDFAESQYVQVVSHQRMYDILKLLGREGARKVNRETATQVARRARARWMLMGSILRMEPVAELASQLVDVSTGNAVASQRVSGKPGDNIFSVVDKLSTEVRKDLALPGGAYQEIDRPVADVTSTSPEAYRLYLAGVEAYHKFYYPEASDKFCDALKLDSTLAMAYYFLSKLSDPKLLEKAILYIDRAGNREKYYIRADAASQNGDRAGAMAELKDLISHYPDEKEAYFNLGLYVAGDGNLNEAITLYCKAIEIDPLYAKAYNQLAYTYDKAGDFEKALWAINKYAELAPDEANPYDSRGEIYWRNGNLDSAIESYRKALAIKPDFATSLENLGRMYIFTGSYKQADSCLEALGITNPQLLSSSRFYRAAVPAYQGKFAQALTAVDAAIAADSAESSTKDWRMYALSKYFLKTLLHLERNEHDRAAAALDLIMTDSSELKGRDYISATNLYIRLLASSGREDEARAKAEILKSRLEKKEASLDAYWIALGLWEYFSGRPSQALANLSRAKLDLSDVEIQYWWARVCLDAGRLEDAIAILEPLRSNYTSPSAYFGMTRVRVHYYLGLAYERSRWFDKAAEQYQIFLKIWKNADPGIPEVNDARSRLAQLQSRS